MKRISNVGFTLVELLVVVLIIGILAAIALPQYQRAVLKSRYSGLMPVANAVANAQEIYYMTHGNYADNNHMGDLDIKAPSGGASAEIEVNDGTDTRFDYVLATRTDAPGVAYVVYQKHSKQFPDTIMCEANDELNPRATWLCHDSLKGTIVETGSLIPGWTAYIIKGTEGSGTFAEAGGCSGTAPGPITNTPSGSVGTAVCNESTGSYEYEWTSVGTMTPRGWPYFPSSAYEYAGFTFSSDPKYVACYASVENGCGGASFTGANATCGGEGNNGCSGSTFTNGASCYGHDYANAGIRACAGAIFKDGGYCKATGTSTDTGLCSGAIIQSGGYCIGMGCADAVYSGTGCCKGDYCGDAPTCDEE